MASILGENGKPKLTWTASADNVGVAGLILRRSGSELGRTSSRSWSDTTAVKGKTYQYNARAFDAAGNVGGRSATLAIKSQ